MQVSGGLESSPRLKLFHKRSSGVKSPCQPPKELCEEHP